MWRSISGTLADAIVGLLVAGVLVGASVAGAGLTTPATALGLGACVVVAAVLVGRTIRTRWPPPGS